MNRAAVRNSDVKKQTAQLNLCNEQEIMQQFLNFLLLLYEQKEQYNKDTYCVFSFRSEKGNLLSNCTTHSVCNVSRRTSNVQRPMKICLFHTLKLIGSYLT